MYNKEKTELLCIPQNRTSYTFPDTVTAVYEYAARGCSKLQSVSIPESVTEIGTQAFGYVSSSEKVPDFTVYGAPGSAAETYASENEFIFGELGTEPVVELVGDHNGDGKVDAADAACILQYAAAVGAGRFSGTLPEFMQQN